MFNYVPSGMPAKAPLVLALHGCTETAADYESAGWNALADTYKFYVVYPQQQSANNIESCFNWFGNTSGSTADITRGQGEAASIVADGRLHEVDVLDRYLARLRHGLLGRRGLRGGACSRCTPTSSRPGLVLGVPFGCANSLTTA